MRNLQGTGLVLIIGMGVWGCGDDLDEEMGAASHGASTAVESASIPGGIVETVEDDEPRAALGPADIEGFMPERGGFMFPEPYNTEGVRLTNAADCQGNDCVNYAGYAYWRNMNQHADSDTMLIFVGLDAAKGGDGLTLFGFDKVTQEVAKLGPLFPEGSHHNAKSGEGMYFSASDPHALYLTEGGSLLRYDVSTQAFTLVWDATEFYPEARLWQTNSSDDDMVHSATLQDAEYRALGCVVFEETTQTARLFEPLGPYDECQVDKSGEWLVIKEDVSGIHGEDNRIVHLPTGDETVLYDADGAAGHSDNGHGYMVAEDNWAANPGSTKLWLFEDMNDGLEVYHSLSFDVDLGHLTHTNAVPGKPPQEQFACSSRSGNNDEARSNEIICYRLDGSQKVLVVAPVMTDMNSAGGGDGYAKRPKANLDPTGEYIFWTTNLGGGRLDAVIARVPYPRLYDS